MRSAVSELDMLERGRRAMVRDGARRPAASRARRGVVRIAFLLYSLPFLPLLLLHCSADRSDGRSR